MAVTFDPASLRIILDSTSVDTTDLYSRWKDWVATGDNVKYPPAFRMVGGDPLGGGTTVSPYFFLQNGWKIRPMEANQKLTFTGGTIKSDDLDGVVVVSTLGTFTVLINYHDPVAAIGVSTGGSGGSGDGITYSQMVALLASTTLLADIKKVNGVTVGGHGVPGDPWGSSV